MFSIKVLIAPAILIFFFAFHVYCRCIAQNSATHTGLSLRRRRYQNRPFPISLVPLFQNKSKCEAFHMKMISACNIILMQIKVIFALALKQRHKRNRKWPIWKLIRKRLSNNREKIQKMMWKAFVLLVYW